MNTENIKETNNYKNLPFTHPTWTTENAPSFLSRTDTVYTSIPTSSLELRGLKNRMMESLFQYLPEGAYIVGGAILSMINGDKNFKDIDIAFTSEKAFKETYDLLMSMETESETSEEESNIWAWKGYTCATDRLGWEKDGGNTRRYIIFTHPEKPAIQLLKLAWYDSPEHIIDSFDLTIAQFAADKEKIYMNPMSILDVARKRIVLHRMQFPASTLRRITKYASKGYYACAGSLAHITEEIRKHVGDPDISETFYVD